VPISTLRAQTTKAKVVDSIFFKLVCVCKSKCVFVHIWNKNKRFKVVWHQPKRRQRACAF